jgi:outer membrane protein
MKTTAIVLLCFLSSFFGQAHAQPATKDSGWTGTVGAGSVTFPKYAGGSGYQSLLLPLAFVEYNGWFYVNLFRAGAHFWSTEDRKQGIGFAVEPRVGYSSGDGPRLAGMAKRRGTLFGGLTYDAENELGSMSLGYFADLGNASRGSYLDLLLSRPLVRNAKWDLSASLELTRSDAKLANYYFGVGAAEVAPARPLYLPGAYTSATLWLTGQYNMTKDYALMFGANVTRLGGSAAASPIVERRDVPFMYVGIGKNL